MDGIAGVGQRIAQIEARIASLGAGSTAASGSTTFDATLAAALATDGATATTSAAGGVDATTSASWTAALRGASSPVMVDGVPADLARYGNGRIPAEALDPVADTGHRLWRPAAGAFEQLLTAAEADGVDIGITDSYRSYDVQVDVVRRKGLYSEGGLGAAPGTSNHGWGMAVDLDLDDDALAWMRANGDRFGFVEDTPREPWHWGYHGV